MEEPDLPCRLIAHGEEPLGDMVSVYNKVKTLNGIFDALDEEEKTFIADSPLGNAKLLDSKRQTLVDPIICLGVETNFADEDLSWTDDEEDARVDNMVSLAEQGFEFLNDMFKGGCIPSELTIAPKMQKRILTTKAVRGKKRRYQLEEVGLQEIYDEVQLEMFAVIIRIEGVHHERGEEGVVGLGSLKVSIMSMEKQVSPVMNLI